MKYVVWFFMALLAVTVKAVLLAVFVGVFIVVLLAIGEGIKWGLAKITPHK